MSTLKTTRSTAQETLEQYRALLEASNTGAWEYHTDTGVLECNEVYFSLLGRNAKDFDVPGGDSLQARWTALLHPEDAVFATARFNHYFNNRAEVYENAFRMQHADGRWLWIWSRGRYLHNNDICSTVRFIGTHVDITAQKVADDEIKRDRILLRTLIDNLPDTIYVKDIQARKIIANKADVDIVGVLSEADLIGKTDLEAMPGEIGKRGYLDDMELLRNGTPILDKEELFYNKEGKKTWLLTSKIPVFNERREISNIIGIGHNITQRKAQEDALEELNRQLKQQSEALSRQADDLKALNLQIVSQQEQEVEKALAQGKFEIASEVLHDIGNALVGFGAHLNKINRVLGRNQIEGIKNLGQFFKSSEPAIAAAIGSAKATAVRVLIDSFIKSSDESYKELGEAVRDLVNIISHIQEILSIQRQLVNGHGVSRNRRPVDICNILNDSLSMLQASFDKKGVHIVSRLSAENTTLKGDPTKLMQVILNVLKNSLEAMENTDDKTIIISLQASAEILVLEITDNGQGFDEATGKKLFERGFTTKTGGTGLGLNSCRSIIEGHSGSFELKSPGIGLGATTTLTFNL